MDKNIDNLVYKIIYKILLENSSGDSKNCRKTFLEYS